MSACSLPAASTQDIGDLLNANWLAVSRLVRQNLFGKLIAPLEIYSPLLGSGQVSWAAALGPQLLQARIGCPTRVSRSE